MPPAITAASVVNRLIICPGSRNKSPPVRHIMPIVASMMVRETRHSFSRFFSPSDWPASVEAAACMP